MKKVNLLFYNDAELLEGPHWDAENGLLYFVSIKADTVFSLDVKTMRLKSYATDGAVGCAVLKSGKLLTAEKNGIWSRDTETGEKSFICHVYSDPKFRYNDGKLDPKGRFFVGTLGDYGRLPGECGLFRIEPDGSFTEVVSGTTVSNGLGWSKDGKRMYFIDTPTHEVWQYDYDPETGEMSNRRTAAVINDGSPDGMCVAADDTVFIAHWGGEKVSHWDLATGQRLEDIRLPVTNVSSCCIGGEKMDTLFITTAKCAEKDEPLAGGLFAVKIGD